MVVRILLGPSLHHMLLALPMRAPANAQAPRPPEPTGGRRGAGKRLGIRAVLSRHITGIENAWGVGHAMEVMGAMEMQALSVCQMLSPDFGIDHAPDLKGELAEEMGRRLEVGRSLELSSRDLGWPRCVRVVGTALSGDDGVADVKNLGLLLLVAWLPARYSP